MLVFIPMPKNVQTTTQLYSSHMLAKWCSKFFKPGFSRMWTVKFQMFKLNLEKQRTRDQIASIPWILEKAREFQENIYFCFIDHTKVFTVWITIKWKILKEMGLTDHLICFLRNLYAGQEATVGTGHGTTDWVPNRKRSMLGCILSPCLFNFHA